MKSTGIVRRIDDLGRIVIPKEMRRTLKIGQNEPLEMFVDGNYLVLKKYADFIDKEKISSIVSYLAESINMPVAVVSCEDILALDRLSITLFKDFEFPKPVDVVKPYIKNNVCGYNKVIYVPSITDFGTNLFVLVFSKDDKDLKEETKRAELIAKVISKL